MYKFVFPLVKIKPEYYNSLDAITTLLNIKKTKTKTKTKRKAILGHEENGAKSSLNVRMSGRRLMLLSVSVYMYVRSLAIYTYIQLEGHVRGDRKWAVLATRTRPLMLYIYVYVLCEILVAYREHSFFFFFYQRETI